MNICVRGLSSVYEPENVARLFFANARLVRRLPRKEDGVLARPGQHPVLFAGQMHGAVRPPARR